MIGSKKSKYWLELFLTTLIFFYPAWRLIPWPTLSQISDFFQYYAVSSLMQNGHYGLIYDTNIMLKAEQSFVPHSLHSYFPFLIPPNVSWIFYPLAWLKFDIAIYIWSIAAFLLIPVSYLILCSYLKITGVHKIWGAALLATSGPYLEAIRLGQLAPLLLFALTLLYISLNQKRYWLAVLGESIFWLKPHILLPILFFQLHPNIMRIPILVCLLGLMGLAVSCTIAGFSIIKNYLLLFSSSKMQANFLGLIYGPTLRGQLLKFSLTYDLSTKLALAAYIFLLIFAFLNRTKSNTSEKQTNVLFTTLVPLSLCFSLHLHNYDLLLLLPGILLLATYALNKPLGYLRLFIISIVLLTSLSPIYVFLHYSYVLQGGLINPFFWTTLIFAIGAFIIERRRNAPSDKSLDINNNC